MWSQFCAAHRHQDGFRRNPRPEISTWRLVVTWAMDINTVLCCCSAMDPHIAFSGSTGWDLIMASSSCIGNSHQAYSHHPGTSSSSSLYSAHMDSHVSTTYLLIIVAPLSVFAHAVWQWVSLWVSFGSPSHLVMGVTECELLQGACALSLWLLTIFPSHFPQ